MSAFDAPRSRRSVLRGIGATGAAAASPTFVDGVRATDDGTAAARSRQDDGPLADPDEFETFVDGLMDAHLEAHSIAGATISVVDGEREFAKGYGYADVAANAPVVADETLFRIGSVSKLFTWSAVAQGVERGDLDLETDVNRYLDAVEIPDAYDDPITLEHLGTHTAGFEERLRGTFVPDEDDVRPLGEMLRNERPSRVRPPGQFASYSNYGSGLAGRVVAETAGTSFESYVETALFEPLSMERSTFDQPVPEDLADDLSKGYTFADGAFREGDFEYVGLPPAGSVSATATDLANFARAFLDDGTFDGDRILESETIEEMHRRRFAHDDRLNGIAYGFYEMNRNGVRVLGHGGDTLLFHSLLFLIPERDVGVFVSYNSAGGVDARDELVDAFFDRYFPVDDDRPRIPDDRPARADDLEGTYRALRVPETTSEKLAGLQSTLSVSVDDRGRLVTELATGETDRWVEVEGEPLLFRSVDGPERLAFREADGELTHLFLDEAPFMPFERIPAHEEPLVHLGLIGISALVFLSAAIGWSIRAGLRRYRGRVAPADESPLRFARWAAGAASASFLAFLVLFGFFLATDPLGFLLGDPLRFRLLLVLPAIGAVCSLVAVGFAGLAWRESRWGRLSRIHYTLVAATGIAFTSLLAYWNLLWYQM